MPCSSPSRRRVALLGVAGALFAAALTPASASALLIDHVQATPVETGTKDGILGPGDTVDLTERIRSSEMSLTGISGTLQSHTTGVSVTQATSGYPDMTFGQEADNLTPFGFAVADSVECGTRLQFTLGLTTAQGTHDVRFDLPTGEAAAPDAYDTTSARTIPDNGTAESTIEVTKAGRVKDAVVRITEIRHTYVGDLQISLIAPDGTRVMLFNRRGTNGDDLLNTVFSRAATVSIADGSAPYTGTFLPEEDLGKLDGVPLQGTWTLEVADKRSGDTGRVEAWGADIAAASCLGAPTARITATPDQVPPGSPVTFDGSGSTDPTGTIQGYAWDLDDDGRFDDGNTATVSHTYLTEGRKKVSLQVTDSSGVTDVGTYELPVSQPPVAQLTATPSSPLSLVDVTFDASASTDPEGRPLARFEWDLDGDGVFERDTGTTATTTKSYSRPGAVPVKVRVTDDIGARTVKQLDLVVQNRAPTAAISAPSPVVVGQTVTISGAGSSDPDGTGLTYEWDLDGDGFYETKTGTVSSVKHAFPLTKTWTIGLRVEDEHGARSTRAETTVRATAKPVAALVATPNPPVLRKPVVLDAGASTDDEGIVAFHWDLDGNGSYETATGTTPRTEITFTAPESRTVRVRVTDGAGFTGSASVSLTASNILPTAALVTSPSAPVAGTPVSFDASGSSDPDGSIVRFEWDLDGDGRYELNTGTTPTTSRSYPYPGVIPVRLKVTDQDGGTSTKALDLSIFPPPSTSTTTGTTSGDTTGTTGTTGTTAGTATWTDPAAWFTGTSPTLRAALVGRPIQRLKTVRRKGLIVYCLADRPARCRLRAYVSGRDALRLGLAKRRKSRKGKKARVRSVTVGRRTIRAGMVRVKLTRKAKRALTRRLKGRRRVKIRFSGTVQDAAGTRLKVRRIVVLRR